MKQQSSNQRGRPTATQDSPQTQGTKSPLGPSTKATSNTEAKPGADEVRRRAYEIYLERQHAGKPGSSTADWEQAERELGSRARGR